METKSVFSGGKEEGYEVKIRWFIFILLLSLGLFYRFFLASLAYKTLLWDMGSYSNVAKGMLSSPFFVDCCQKGGGYPAFLAVIYSLFGVENLMVIRAIQVFIDIITAVLVYLIAKRLFPQAAWVSFVLYLFHPLGASYVGLILPETITAFLLATVTYISVLPQFQKNTLLWFLFGAVLGYILFTRISFFYFIFILIIIFLFYTIPKIRRVQFFILTVMGFLIVSSYSLYSYYRHFRVVSFTPPYHMGITSSLYMSFYMGRSPELISDYDKQDPAFIKMLLEYNTTHYSQNAGFRKKYRELFAAKIRADWPLFIKNTFRNMIWTWDIYHLFYYSDPFYPADTIILRFSNVIIVTLFILGIVSFARGNRIVFFHNPVVILTLLLIFYLTLFYSPISNETRYIASLYPLILLWAGYGINILINKLTNKSINQ